MVHCDPQSVLYTWVCRMLSDHDVSKSRFGGLTPLTPDPRIPPIDAQRRHSSVFCMFLIFAKPIALDMCARFIYKQSSQ